MNALLTNAYTNLSGGSERERFISIVNRSLAGDYQVKAEARRSISDFILFSPQREKLIDTFIRTCVNHTSVHRLDFAIDTLAILDKEFQTFALSYLDQEMKQSDLFTGKWHPDHNYWYVLLRALAKCSKKSVSLMIISACQDEIDPAIGEAVVEALADMCTVQSTALLTLIASTHANPLTKQLAQEYLDECN